MDLLGGLVSVQGVPFLMMSVFVIAALGYILGRITIKGVSLGTAGVFVVALVYGALFSDKLSSSVTQAVDGGLIDISSSGLKIVENIGLIMFVAAVGFIAGPTFFKDLKKNYKSYILLGFIIILSGGIACVACYFLGRGAEENSKEFVAMLVGILAGGLTSTPAFSAAKATVDPAFEDAVTVGYGIAYLFGVVGVVLFVQLIPKLTKANMKEEIAKITIAETSKAKEIKTKLVNMDEIGLMPFSLAAVIGILIGAIKIPLSFIGLEGNFSLTTTGGALFASLIFGHLGHIGKFSLQVNKKVLEIFRELGLMLFLIGAGVAGGAKFIQYFKPIYFVYGVIMTTVPMIIGYLFAKYVLKLSLLNNLGSITGGMTSTPALGTLISVAKTDAVASAYAATYPIALIAVVLVSQLIIILL